MTIQLGFVSLLGLMFVFLKLTGQIAWPWLWVLAPFWGPFVFILVVLMVIGILELL